MATEIKFFEGVLDDAIRRGIINIITEVERLSVERVPVVTTNLLNSITSDVDGLVGRVNASANYALFVHEGHMNRGGKSYCLPNPFLRSSLEEVVENIDELFAEGFNR